MSLYTEYRDNLADNLLRQFGVSVVVRRAAVGQVVNSMTGVITTAGTDENHTTIGIFKDVKKSQWAGIQVTSDMRQMVLSATDFAEDGFVPVVGDLVVYAGEIFVIKDLKPVAPAGVVVVYKVLVGR